MYCMHMSRVSDYFDIPLLKSSFNANQLTRFHIGVNSLKWSVYDNAVLVDNLFIQNVIMNLINYYTQKMHKFMGKKQHAELSTENYYYFMYIRCCCSYWRYYDYFQFQRDGKVWLPWNLFQCMKKWTAVTGIAVVVGRFRWSFPKL